MDIRIIYFFLSLFFATFAFGYPINFDKYLLDVKRYYIFKGHSSCVPDEMSGDVPKKIIDRFINMNFKTMSINDKKTILSGHVDGYEQININLRDGVGWLVVTINVKDGECKFFELDQVFDEHKLGKEGLE